MKFAFTKCRLAFDRKTKQTNTFSLAEMFLLQTVYYSNLSSYEDLKSFPYANLDFCNSPNFRVEKASLLEGEMPY